MESKVSVITQNMGVCSFPEWESQPLFDDIKAKLPKESDYIVVHLQECQDKPLGEKLADAFEGYHLLGESQLAQITKKDLKLQLSSLQSIVLQKEGLPAIDVHFERARDWQSNNGFGKGCITTTLGGKHVFLNAHLSAVSEMQRLNALERILTENFDRGCSVTFAGDSNLRWYDDERFDLLSKGPGWVNSRNETVISNLLSQLGFQLDITADTLVSNNPVRKRRGYQNAGSLDMVIGTTPAYHSNEVIEAPVYESENKVPDHKAVLSQVELGKGDFFPYLSCVLGSGDAIKGDANDLTKANLICKQLFQLRFSEARLKLSYAGNDERYQQMVQDFSSLNDELRDALRSHLVFPDGALHEDGLNKYSGEASQLVTAFKMKHPEIDHHRRGISQQLSKLIVFIKLIVGVAFLPLTALALLSGCSPRSLFGWQARTGRELDQVVSSSRSSFFAERTPRSQSADLLTDSRDVMREQGRTHSM